VDQLHVILGSHGPVLQKGFIAFTGIPGKTGRISGVKPVIRAGFSKTNNRIADGNRKTLLDFTLIARTYTFPVNVGSIFALEIHNEVFIVSPDNLQVPARNGAVVQLNLILNGPPHVNDIGSELKRLDGACPFYDIKLCHSP
jgi:hypothetical protein